MKATELINMLHEYVNKHGDREVVVNGEYNNDYPINTASFLKISRIDIFDDSDDIQIMVINE